MDDVKIVELMLKGNTRGLEALIGKYRGLRCCVSAGPGQSGGRARMCQFRLL